MLIKCSSPHCSAVRFGRIPKREKQRMLLEMQSAMNNMMNNSQLHNNQSLSVGKEAHLEDAGPAPSCSPSSRSDSSSEPEPAMAMDTSPSSASPSASDSGEEEVIGSVTRAHQETFMYNQEQSSLPAQAPPPAGPLTASSSGGGQAAPGIRTEEQQQQQEAWNNHHNNMVTMATQEAAPSTGPPPQDDNAGGHCPFRLSRGSAPSHCPAYAHKTFQALSNEGAASGPHSAPLWRGGNRMYLVRPQGPAGQATEPAHSDLTEKRKYQVQAHEEKMMKKKLSSAKAKEKKKMEKKEANGRKHKSKRLTH